MENIKKEKLKDLFERDGNFLAETCKKVDDRTNFLGYDFYHNMEEFDTVMSLFTPSEIAKEIKDSKSFDIKDEYFSFGGDKFEGLRSFYNLYDFYTQFEDKLCDAILEYYYDILDILDFRILNIIQETE